MASSGDAYLEDARRQFEKLRKLGDKALDQVSEADFFATLDGETNSVALIVKHVSGNLRSRWTDFLTRDGEKPDRHRDREFVVEAGDSKVSLLARWDAGWETLFDAVGPLRADDLERTVTIRGEPHSVIQALNRQLTHYAYHVGQIVLLARHFSGPDWQSLSIPRGKSSELEVAKDGSSYVVSPKG